MKRIYVDTEYCYPGMSKGTPRPTASDLRQVVQIAAILYDTQTGEEIASFNELVKPTYEERVAPFFEELTGISQAEIDTKARPLDIIMDEFYSFCRNFDIWTFHKDEEVLRQNCGYISKEWPFAQHFVQVKLLLSAWGINPEKYSSGTLYEAANLCMEGFVHNALHDVRSMAAAVREFERNQKP